MSRLLSLATLLLPGALVAQNSGVTTAAASITEEDFFNRVGVIAHDSMRGRDTPSPGLDMTARWIAGEFRRFGLEPGGADGSFLQEYVIEQVVPDLENSVVRVSGGPDLAFGTDVLAGFGIPPEEERPGSVSILAGGSLPADLSEDRVRGRHIVVVPAEATGVESQRAQMRLLIGLVGAGAASVLVMSRQSDAEWTQAVALQTRRAQSRTSGQAGARAFPAILRIRERSLARVLEARSLVVPTPPTDPLAPGTLTPVPDLAFTIAARTRVIREDRAPNTVGILEGSDPMLKGEYVVFSGHMDHVGVGNPNAEGDSAYNGADDDASGTVAVVELAEAFAMLDPAPKRSMLFLAVSGEEKGLWGSEYFVRYPPVPMESMVADLNADMIARNWPDSIVVIGKDHSDLGKTLERVATAHPELNMVPMDDIWPDEDFYSRSDHINFARSGVPVLFFFNGTHEDYHQPTDELENINAEKAARITRLLFYLGLEVANAPDRPKWDPEAYAEIVGGGGR
ncbi:MAG: M28 family peptidase [Longimicrobiales bacterium]